MLATVFHSSQAQAAISIDSDEIVSVGLTEQLGQLSISSQDVKGLKPGAVVPSMMAANITDPKTVANALETVFKRYKRAPKRIAMVLPDTIAKVTLLSFDAVPDRESDLEQLIRLKMKRSAPFSLDDAQLSYLKCGTNRAKQSQFLVVVVQKTILAEYEDVCSAAALKVGCVDLASFNLINTYLYIHPHRQPVDWMLVHVARYYTTVALVRGAQLIFFRTQAIGPGTSLENFIHQTTMYHEDRLDGNGIERVVFLTTESESKADALEPVLRRAFHDSPKVAFEELGTQILTAIKSEKQLALPTVNRLAAPIGILLRDRHN